MAGWSFLTTHARVLLFLAAHPDARLRDIAEAVDVTERTAFGVVADLAEAGYLMKERAGRRNRYQVQANLPLGDELVAKRTVGELLSLLDESSGWHPSAAAARPSKRASSAVPRSRLP